MSRETLFTDCLALWFEVHKRDFPWRHTHDPYKIWIAEVMSHQTQIDRVADKFYPRFLEAFPTIEALAEADWETQVFPLWEGLGYYRRGQNMIRTAQAIVVKHNGVFPQNSEDLQALSGIGAYTSAAIMAFAFDVKIPAVDTNISKIVRTLWPKANAIAKATQLVELSASGCEWNGAMMDLASALRAGKTIEGELGEAFFPPEVAEQFKPVRKKPAPKKRKVGKRIEVGIACIYENGAYLAQTRPEGKSFVGSWEFPGGKREKGEDLRACVKREITEEIGCTVSVRPHFYEEVCHFKDNDVELVLRFHRCQIQSGRPTPLEGQKIEWVKPEDFFQREFLKTNHKALRKLQKMRV